jgi:hypothetical protein
LFRQKLFFRKASVAHFEASVRRAGGILMDGPYRLHVAQKIRDGQAESFIPERERGI